MSFSLLFIYFIIILTGKLQFLYYKEFLYLICDVSPQDLHTFSWRHRHCGTARSQLYLKRHYNDYRHHCHDSSVGSLVQIPLLQGTHCNSPAGCTLRLCTADLRWNIIMWPVTDLCLYRWSRAGSFSPPSSYFSSSPISTSSKATFDLTLRWRMDYFQVFV